MGLTEYVMNDTSPSTMLVPMLSTMDTPMAAMNSTGSIHESVESTSRSRMAGTMMATAPNTSCTVFAWSCSVSIASPDTAFAKAPAACGGVVGARLVNQAAQGGDGRAFLAFGDGHLEQRRARGFDAGRGA